MSFWLDCGIAVLIAIFCFFGYRRGLIYMIVNTAGTIVAIVTASITASSLAQPVYDWLCRENIIKGLTLATKGIARSDAVQMAKDTLAVVDNFTKNVLSFMGVSEANLAQKLDESVIGLPGTLEEMLRPAVIGVITVILTFIFFLLAMIIVNVLSKKLNKTINHTILGFPNKIGGAAVGLVCAVFVAMLLMLIVYFIMMFITPEKCLSLKDAIDNTFFFNLIRKINLPQHIMEWIAAI